MIDRAARDEMALLLRRLACGRITNDEFEDGMPESDDAAIWAVFRDGAWFLYSDLSEHRLTGSVALSPDERREVARWILFLKGEREYEWHVRGPVGGLFLNLLGFATLGLTSLVYGWICRRKGELAVWPFRCRGDLRRAAEDPPFLRGTA